MSRTVAVIGGGYAGSAVAKALDDIRQTHKELVDAERVLIVGAAPVGLELAGSQGQVPVTETLNVHGHDHVYAIGDITGRPPVHRPLRRTVRHCLNPFRNRQASSPSFGPAGHRRSGGRGPRPARDPHGLQFP
jgi:NADH dehydrogenase FAD-containing subunit